MEQKENQRVRLTRRLIKESLVRLTLTNQPRRISIRTLCEDSGINRSTFYKYYGSQHDVMEEIELDFLDSIQHALEAIELPDGSQIESICTYLERNAQTARFLLTHHTTPDFPRKIFSLPQVQQMLREQIRHHYDRADEDSVFSFLCQGCYSVVKEWLCCQQRQSAKEIARLIHRLISCILSKH